jgi:hypothetical protein
MALERLTKDNFVDHPPFFPVYDYWYNELVDAFNAMVPTPGIVSGISAIYGGDSGIVNVEGVGLYDGMVEATNIRTFMVTIGVDQIVGNAANALNHADGAPLYGPASGNVVEFVSAVLVYDFGVAAYTGGGNDTVIRVGATAITDAVTSANLLGAAGDKIVVMYPLSTAAIPLVQAASLNLFSGTAWTQPSTAAGVIRAFVTIRIHETGL